MIQIRKFFYFFKVFHFTIIWFFMLLSYDPLHSHGTGYNVFFFMSTFIYWIFYFISLLVRLEIFLLRKKRNLLHLDYLLLFQFKMLGENQHISLLLLKAVSVLEAIFNDNGSVMIAGNKGTSVCFQWEQTLQLLQLLHVVGSCIILTCTMSTLCDFFHIMFLKVISILFLSGTTPSSSVLLNFLFWKIQVQGFLSIL